MYSRSTGRWVAFVLRSGYGRQLVTGWDAVGRGVDRAYPAHAGVTILEVSEVMCQRGALHGQQ